MTELKLARTRQQWQDSVPEIIAAGSKAQVLFALRDAKHDVLALVSALEIEREERLEAERESEELRKWDKVWRDRVDRAEKSAVSERSQRIGAERNRRRARTAPAEVSDGK